MGSSVWPNLHSLIDYRLNRVLPAIDQILKTFGTPSLVCGVLHQGDIVFTHGTGLADIDRKISANEDTVYPVASCTKAFTAACCGILVDEGRISWTEPVQSYLPEFQTTQDPEIGKRATLIDLCSHGTGSAPVDRLVFGFFREPWITGKQQVQTASNLPVCYDFRSHWLYNNSMFGVVGDLVSSVSGQSSGTFLQERIFQPLGMTRSSTKAADLPSDGNFAQGYAVLDDGSLHPVGFSALDDGCPQGGAGYVTSSVRDMLVWARAVMEAEVDGFDREQASNREQGKGERHNPLRQMQFMRCAHRPTTLRTSGYENSYGLGWFRHMLPSSQLASIAPNFGLLPDPPIINQAGPPRLTIAHWGDFNGFLTALYTFPTTRSAVVVMTNSSCSGGDPADLVAQMLAQELFNMQPRVPLEDYAIKAADTAKRRWPALVEEWVSNRIPNTKYGPLDGYTGSFTNTAYSMTITVYKLSPDVIGTPENSPELLGFTVNSIARQSAKLRHYHHDTWTFLPDSRDDALRKGMEGFLCLSQLLLSFVRDETGIVCGLEWGLQDGLCGGPAPGISTSVAPIRFDRQAGVM